jgi:hypothetical protein
MTCQRVANDNAKEEINRYASKIAASPLKLLYTAIRLSGSDLIEMI